MHHFYTPEISIDNKEFTLSEPESKHAVKVLRLQENDSLILIDGKGIFYHCSVIDPHPKRCKVLIQKTVQEENSKPHFHIAIAPTKNNDRLEWFIEKATEIGIAEITPIICDHSERKVVKQERLIKTAIAAMKQSLKASLPKINEAVSLKSFLSQQHGGDLFIAHCADAEKKHLSQHVRKSENSLVLIGPEGDFSPEEIDLALQRGFTPISLGTSRLRTETAGIVAIHSLNLMNE